MYKFLILILFLFTGCAPQNETVTEAYITNIVETTYHSGSATKKSVIIGDYINVVNGDVCCKECIVSSEDFIKFKNGTDFTTICPTKHIWYFGIFFAIFITAFIIILFLKYAIND
jgi:hypothetical protein